MHFEIKSTFLEYKDKLGVLIGNVPHTAWVLFINITVAATAVHLYLSDVLIPATIGSKYYGSHYITIIKAGMYFHFISSSYALAGLVVRWIVNRVNYNGSDVFILKLFYCIRQSSVIIVMLIHLTRLMPRRGYAPMTDRDLSGFILPHYPFEENQ